MISHKEVTLIHGDCLEIMKEIADTSVDLILCDLPYGSTACAWDSVIPFEILWGHYRRIISPTGAIVLTGSQPFTSALVMSNPSWFKYSWVWEKNRASGHVHAKNKPMKKHEDICVFSPGNTLHASQSTKRMTYNPQGLIELADPVTRKRNDAGDNAVMSKRMSHKPTSQTHGGYPTSIIRFDIPMNENRFHPTQKPVDLMEYLVRTYSNDGDTVLDNCMGSGTTGLACINSCRNFIGIEKDENYYEIACQRIQLHNQGGAA
ncbi:site-specific DNA-methyltransferase [Enterobacter asburiae]|nr:site-specific DNA-methyltransferase [Enterobacter asburiae]